MRTAKRTILAFSFAGLVSLGLAGCNSLGPERLPADRFDYSEAILQSAEEQMLANLVRLRYFRLPTFLQVSSVLTQYTYEGGAGLFGQRGFGSSSDNIGGTLNFGYAERPTITYAPLSGSDFSKQLLTPISTELLFSAALAGYSVDTLFLATLQQINEVANMSFGDYPGIGTEAASLEFKEDFEKYRRFNELLRLMYRLVEFNALELQRLEADGPIYLVLDPKPGPDAKLVVEEFRSYLDLDPGIDRFAVTERLATRRPDEITIRTRSVMGAMAFLSRGIEVPLEHIEEGRVIPMRISDGDTGQRIPISLTILTTPADPGDGPPPGAMVAVRYEGYWFYVSRSDILSMRAFSDLMWLYNIQAPDSGGAVPLLSLPTG